MPTGNYMYTVDSSFQPFNMQEMLVPFSAYKDAFEKSEEQYDQLSQNADKFKYLSETLPEGSKARQIYEGYANELRTQAEDFAHNGLTMGNRRALTSLKRRYQGEIGRLLEADEAMREEKKLRRSINAQDHSMLYADDNLNIDNFLDGNTPNLYSVSGNELYARGAEAGKAASSRMVNVGEGNITLGGYYRDLVSKYGYSPELLAKFRQDMNAIPELKASLDDYMEASGVNQNLSGYNRDRATQYYLQGMLNGAIYQENHNPQRDLGILTKAEQVADARAKEQIAFQKLAHRDSLEAQGFSRGKDGHIVYNPDNDPRFQQAKTIAEIKANGSGKNRNNRTSAYDTRNKGITMIGANTGTKYRNSDKEDKERGYGTDIDMSTARALTDQEFNTIIDPTTGNIKNEYIKSAIGNGNLSDYEIYKIPKGATLKSGWFSDDKSTEDVYILKPRDTKKSATDPNSLSDTVSNSGTNDIPS